MKKICFLIGNMSLSGGTERVSSIIANALETQGYDVSILSISEGLTSFFELNKKVRLYSLFSHAVSMKRNYIGCCLKIRRFVQDHNIDTLIVVDSISCMFTVPALIGLKVKHICWEHFNFNVDLGVSFRRIGRKWAAKHCDYVVTLTKRDKELWESGLKNIKAQIIPIANPTPYENIEHKPDLKYKTVLALGRLTDQKGFDLLIDAWSHVCNDNEDWILRIVGSGEDEGVLKKLAKNLSVFHRIEFIPATKNVEQYYKTSSFYCMSSRFEGLPMVLLEAQAFGLPVVSFDCDTGPSDLVANGINGFLVNSKDINELSIAMKRMIESDVVDYEGFVEQSKKTNSLYRKESIIQKWIEII